MVESPVWDRGVGSSSLPTQTLKNMKKYTDIVIVLDRSGSMLDVRSEMEEGINSFINKQKENVCKISLFKFERNYEKVFVNLKPNEVPYIRIEPYGTTALFDAIGKTIKNINIERDETPKFKHPYKTLVIIITDGEENDSRIYNQKEIVSMVESCKRKGWDFLFMGADQDAVLAGNNLGIERNWSYTYTGTPTGIINMFDMISDSVNNYCNFQITSFMTEEQRRILDNK